MRSTGVGRTQRRPAGPRPRAPGHPLAAPLPQRIQRLIHHTARPDLRPRLLNAASPCAQLRRRRRTLGDGSVPCSNQTRGQKGFSCRVTVAVYRGTGWGSHERHRSCRRRAYRRPSPCRSRGVRSEARRRPCCPCAPPDARGLQDIGVSDAAQREPSLASGLAVPAAKVNPPPPAAGAEKMPPALGAKSFYFLKGKVNKINNKKKLPPPARSWAQIDPHRNITGSSPNV